MLLANGLAVILRRALWRILTRHSLPNAENPMDRTVCLQFAFCLISRSLTRCNPFLKGPAFLLPTHLMASTFVVNFQLRSETRQSERYGDSHSKPVPTFGREGLGGGLPPSREAVCLTGKRVLISQNKW